MRFPHTGSHAERPEKFGGGVPFHPGVLEVVVVRPDRETQVEREREYVNVVWIARADAAIGLQQVVFVLGTLHDGDWEGRQCEQEGVQMKALLLGEGTEVLEDLIVGDGRREDLLDLSVPEHQRRASANNR